ncbi:hypothetical protein V3N99_15820 [Dermatophilaceae bacterium Soc4.6]
MRLGEEQARARLAAEVHGVLVTLHPRRGPDPQPVVFAVTDDGFLGVPIDTVKPKSPSRLRREDNLDADPRGSLLVEHWEVEDWSRLWWVRAELRHVPDPPAAVVDDLADRLSRTVSQYADKLFHRVLVCRIVALTGWATSSDCPTT